MEPPSENQIDNVSAELVHPLTDFDEFQDCWEIPLCANSWLVNAGDNAVITSCGLGNWTEDEVVTRVFFHVKTTVKLELAVRCKVPEGKSLIEVNVCGVPRVTMLEGPDYRVVPVGKFRIFGTGYIKVDLKGLQKTGPYYADVSHLVVAKKSLPDDMVYYIMGEDSDETYWHRRGPSLHLSYKIPEECGDQEYYYNEVTVPDGFDRVGSYFMAIGFDGGYFGIQVNSPEERRVLFSIWSPQDTDNPEDITDDNAVLAINKGENVHVGEFGNEGSCGKSYLVYHWSPGVTYNFLVRGRPDPMLENYTLFSAWFEQKSSPNWKLIAEFSRPKTFTYLSSFYSFLENFDQHEGSTCRKCYFNNQWVRDTDGKWYEITEAKITGDGTAKDMVRLDFEGGVAKNEDTCDGFYLKHCGFFVGACNLSTTIERPAVCKEPCAENRAKKPQQRLIRSLKVEDIDSDQSWKSNSDMFEIPLKANGWLTNEDADAPGVITQYGMGNWISLDTEVHVFFFVRKSAKFNLFVRCKVPDGRSEIEVSVCGAVSKTIPIEGGDYHNVFLGRYRFLGRDYVDVALKGVSREGGFIADVSHLLIPKDELGDDPVACIDDFGDLQASRRGPSILLEYLVPMEMIPNEFVYTDVCISREYSQLESKVVAIGFEGGYLGIQDGDKIILQMVTDESDQVTVGTSCIISEGDGVVTNSVPKGDQVLTECTTEMTWPADTIKCRFLLRARPDPDEAGFARYCAWYHHSSEGDWKMLAEVRNRSSQEPLSRFHSAVANLNPDNGHLVTKATFGKQMVRKVNGEVLDITRSHVKVRTSRARVDYDVSVVDTEDHHEGFAVRTGGFLKGDVVDGAVLSRRSEEGFHEIDFEHFL